MLDGDYRTTRRWCFLARSAERGETVVDLWQTKVAAYLEGRSMTLKRREIWRGRGSLLTSWVMENRTRHSLRGDVLDNRRLLRSMRSREPSPGSGRRAIDVAGQISKAKTPLALAILGVLLVVLQTTRQPDLPERPRYVMNANAENDMRDISSRVGALAATNDIGQSTIASGLPPLRSAEVVPWQTYTAR